LEIICKTLGELPKVASEIIKWVENEQICLVDGQMGAGKTTLIKAICEQLGVIDNVSSPTFSIVNEYLTHLGKSIYHFDFYRLKSEREAWDMGIEEYFDSGNLCFLEWSSQIPSFIPARHLHIQIHIVAENQRVIKLSKYE
jgi:tRNA threonylcarbamoyladenosine biosynthesis protein TsaE